MRVFIAGIALACAGTVVAQFAMTPQHEQAQAAPAATVPTPEPTYQHITSLPFDAATYNVNQSIPYGTVDGPDPAKLWDESGDSTARSAEGWDGTSPSIPNTTTAKTSSKGATSSTSKSAGSKTRTAKAGTAKTGTTAKSPSVAAARVPQGTKGALATPQTLSQGPSVKPVRVPLY